MYPNDGVPPGSIPHHYVSYYVSLYPNEDVAKFPKAKPFRERKTPYPDTISDMKRPFDHSHDMPTHVVHNIEIKDLPTLPRNMNWCYPELNMYAQVGRFPLSFQKELFDYYNESIAYMCDKPLDCDRMNEHFAHVDKPYGVPDELQIPSQAKVDWCRWAHERTMNAGYDAEDSHKWLLERDLDWKILQRGTPPSMTRSQFNSPDGLFPQNWPEPDDDPNEANR
eukprot:3004822-Amphidinium_carterae.1